MTNEAKRLIAKWMSRARDVEVNHEGTYLSCADELQDVVDDFESACVQPDEVDILEEALNITKGDRQNAYGPPDQDFARTAKMWEQLLQPLIKLDQCKGDYDNVIPRLDIPPRMVAACMIVLKLSRETHQSKRDNWVDTAGYARCGDICREMEEPAKGIDALSLDERKENNDMGLPEGVDIGSPPVLPEQVPDVDPKEVVK